MSFSLELKQIFVFVLPKFKKIFVNILNLIIIIFALSSQLKKTLLVVSVKKTPKVELIVALSSNYTKLTKTFL